jgi:uncharacterized protein (DUF1330 family)
MELSELTSAALDAASPVLGTGPVTMVNLVRFRPEVDYPAGFDGARTDPRSGYFDGYAGAFRIVARDVGVHSVEVLFRGRVAAGLVTAPEDRWDEVVIVRYGSFEDFRNIVESPRYKTLAEPHRRAAVANWRLFATLAD